MSFSDLKRNLKKDFSGLRKTKLALLGDSATQFFGVALRGEGFEQRLDIDVWQADYDQIDHQISDPDSDFYRGEPDFVVLFPSTPKLMSRFYGTPVESREGFVDTQAHRFENWAETLGERLPNANVIFVNFAEIDDRVFGNFANKTAISFLYQVRSINLGLMQLAQRCKHVFICDAATLVAEVGSASVVDSRLFYDADLVFNLDFTARLAVSVVQVIGALTGTFKKCVVLDLDNTLWGGVIGDDGLQNIEVGGLGRGKAFSALQHWAKELKNRGVLLAVCSKNDEAIASEPFRSHPEMVLRLEDFAAFVANWDSKVQNIHAIRAQLNISFDSMVFIDDNPYERGVVALHIPEVTVPELPEDPVDYLTFLKALNLFETASLTEEDRVRTSHFQQEKEREISLKAFSSEEEFLKSLDMKADAVSLSGFNIPRAAQLIQRSNQFNLRTVRYSEAELTSISSRADWQSFAVSVQDRFGSYGLISVVLAQVQGGTLFIDTWVMSCRVLKRGVEHAVLALLISRAKSLGLNRIVGEYRETPKNKLVQDHFANLGFSDAGEGLWSLDVDESTRLVHFIAVQTNGKAFDDLASVQPSALES